MNDGLTKSYIRAGEELPCGCVLEHRARMHPGISMNDLWGCIQFWFQDRKDNHVCDYVTPDNPAGHKKKHLKLLMEKGDESVPRT